MTTQFEVKLTIGFGRFLAVATVISMTVESDDLTGCRVAEGEDKAILECERFEIYRCLIAMGEPESGEELRIEPMPLGRLFLGHASCTTK